MQLVLASANENKVVELESLFAPLGFELVTQTHLGIASIDEPFHTFVENALRKARHAAQHSGQPALSDDAGLCVDALDGQPGVHTAFYASSKGYPQTNENNVRALLEAMQSQTMRRAALVCTLVAVRTADEPEPLIASARVVGEITHEPRGKHGFGFDPVLWIPELNATLAEVDAQTKHRYSHRGKAARQMVELMKTHW